MESELSVLAYETDKTIARRIRAQFGSRDNVVAHEAMIRARCYQSFRDHLQASRITHLATHPSERWWCVAPPQRVWPSREEEMIADLAARMRADNVMRLVYVAFDTAIDNDAR